METNDRVEPAVDVVAYHKELAIRKFTNKLAMQLKPSNDTMEAIRLFRNELPNFLTAHEQEVLSSLHARLVEGVKGMKVIEDIKPTDDSLKAHHNYGMKAGYNFAIDEALTIINSVFKKEV